VRGLGLNFVLDRSVFQEPSKGDSAEDDAAAKRADAAMSVQSRMRLVGST
jgi:hypothetical protein